MAFKEYTVATEAELAKVNKTATLMDAKDRPWSFGPNWWTAEQKDMRYWDMAANLPLTVVFETEEA